MKNIIKIIILTPILFFSSCLGDSDEEKYSEWKKQNIDYFEAAKNSTQGGEKIYQQITPSWMPGATILMKWHNDRSLTQNNLQPLFTSTVKMKYELELINGTKVQNSYSYADSAYSSSPRENITGFGIAMLNMHVGDSVTVIIPYQFGYGTSGTTGIDPYSTLIFHVKMKEIIAYDIQ